MCGKGEILALDMNHDRLLRLRENSHRLGMGCIQSVVADAVNPPLPMPGRPYDKILIDGPCSALGTISRHPDAKWFRNEQDIKRLSLLQREILNGTAPLLCKGGEILYVTCTVSKEENEEVVFDFLKKNRDMTLMDLRDHVPEWGRALIDTQGFFRSLPHVHGMDGFFGALFTKNDK
jgi:16S rRNA (cytosine967-C5)-methyltransferase